MRSACLCVVLLSVLGSISWGQCDIVVPDECGTIQEAADVAAAGQTICLRPGVYQETLYLAGKHVTIRSWDEATGGLDPAGTIIDGGHAVRPFEFGPTHTGPVTLEGLTFRRGYGYEGGAVYSDTAELIIRDCIFTDNHTGGDSYNVGGAVYMRTAPMTVQRCTFTGNTAEDGGAICAFYDELYLEDCVFEDNRAVRSHRGGNGGVLYKVSSPCRFTNCLFVGNTAHRGGAIDFTWCYPKVVNCVFYDNSATELGGAIVSFRLSNVVLRNTILWGNDAPQAPQVAVGPPPYYASDAEVHYCCVEGGRSGVELFNGVLVWGDGNIESSPVFADGPGGDFHLLAASSCIDAGDVTLAPALDFDGVARPRGGGFDIGAYELPVTEVSSGGGQFGTGWNLMSLPGRPAPSHASAALADLAALGNLLGTSFFDYTAGVGYGMYPGDFSHMSAGCGYWLNLSVGGDVSFFALAADVEAEIPLFEGWTLIGHPFEAPALLADCSVTDGIEVKSYEDAVSAGWLTPPLYFYESTSYKSLMSGGSGDDNSLRAWHGYWCLSEAPGLSMVISQP